MDPEDLNPAYLQGLTVRNLLSISRTELQRLSPGVPADKQTQIADLYDKLCLVQGELESLLDDLPAVRQRRA